MAALILAGGLFAQQVDDPLLAKLQPELREQGAALLRETEEPNKRRLIRELVAQHGVASIDFLLGVLGREDSAMMRAEILDRLGQIPSSRVAKALTHHATSDPDVNVAILALGALRTLQTKSMMKLLEQRLEMARQAGAESDQRVLLQEQERWILLARGSTVPGFMLTPPPVFAAKPAGGPIRVLAFGDLGQEGPFQKPASEAMLAYHRRKPFDFAITLGDNFYPRGMASPSDARWKSLWDGMYDALGIPFYASLGNHDWGLPDSPAAEVIYSGRSPSWRMPATRYSFTAGEAQFFALDTQTLTEQQLLWLAEELDRSTARWKIVYGHHPIYSHGVHGDTGGFAASLLPVLRDRADIYICGHEHDLQHLKPEGRLHFFIAGGGGARIRPIEPGPRTLFAKSSYGFAVIEADRNRLKVTFVDERLQELYNHTIGQ